MMYDKNVQDLAITKELRTAINLIKHGLSHIQKIDGANDFYHLPILSLSSGFERLMKIIICLHKLETEGNYPKTFPWPTDSRGHDLKHLLEIITNDCYNQEYISKIPAALNDITYLRDNKKLVQFITILSNFGIGARYYYLNVILSRKNKTLSPEKEWENLETTLLKNDPDWTNKFENDPNLIETYKFINKEIITLFERFARALCRLFTIGGLGEIAKRNSPMISDFLYLMDNELGNASY